MIKITPSLSVSSLTTKGLIFLPTDSTPTSLTGIIATEYMHFYADLSTPPPTVTSERSIKNLVDRWENDPERAAALSDARRVLGRRLDTEKKFSIAQLRLQKGLSQTKLGELMGGVAQPQVARIERGDDIKFSTIEKLAGALDMAEADVCAAVIATRKARGHVE